jgi:hypothetical protein
MVTGVEDGIGDGGAGRAAMAAIAWQTGHNAQSPSCDGERAGNLLCELAGSAL